MNIKITYDVRCKICHSVSTYVLRDTNVNPMDDKSAEMVMTHYKEENHRFTYCETCHKLTKQEIVTFDF